LPGGAEEKCENPQSLQADNQSSDLLEMNQEC